jgi:hypothetical protein
MLIGSVSIANATATKEAVPLEEVVLARVFE